MDEYGLNVQTLVQDDDYELANESNLCACIDALGVTVDIHIAPLPED